jgi:hypothetical protein
MAGKTQGNKIPWVVGASSPQGKLVVRVRQASPRLRDGNTALLTAESIALPDLPFYALNYVGHISSRWKKWVRWIYCQFPVDSSSM